MDKITYKEIMYELPNDERKFNQGKVQKNAWISATTLFSELKIQKIFWVFKEACIQQVLFSQD